MDQEAIESELNCSICLDTYTDPKILQCFHVYCQKCLVKLVVRDQQEQLSLSCPICRQVTPVPAGGTAGLQSAFHINRLLEILDQHKKGLASAEKADSKAQGLPPCNISALHCSEHSEREVELFCETCGELICSMCAIKGGKHHSHDYLLINESFERFREQVTPSLEPMEKNMAAITKVLAQLDRQCEEITDQQATIEAEIRDSSKRLHEIIEKRENELIDQLDQITKTKLKSLAAQIDQIETLQAQLSSCLEFARESLKTGSIQPEVLAMKKDVLKQVRELTTASQPDIFTLNTKADVMFSASVNAAATECECYGKIYVSLKCVATGRGTEEAMVGELATVAVSFEGCQNNASTPFKVKLASEMTGGKVYGRVERCMEYRGQGQYVVSYQPTVKGRHQLHIKADDQHIKGSPFSVTVKLPVEKLGTPILTLNQPRDPWGVAVTGKGEVVVTEWGTNSVSVFSVCGKKHRTFGLLGSGDGELFHPRWVAVDGEGNLLVADGSNHRIQKFTMDGRFLRSAGCWGIGPLQLRHPHGIAYSASNNEVYVVDGDNHRVHVMNSDLRFISIFGKKGRGKGQFNCPRGVAIDSTGRVYVADSGNHRIQVFTSEGEFLDMFGKKGAGWGELNWPFGIAVDASGLVYVSEYDNHRVSVFTSEGRFVTSFGSKGQETGQFDTPRGLAVDSSGVVYVCDRNICRYSDC